MLTDEQIIDLLQYMKQCFKKSYKILANNLKELDLTFAQSQVIRVLADKGPMPLIELTKILETTPSSLSGMLDRLERAGLVTRERDGHRDRRVVWAKLTNKAEELFHNFPSAHIHYYRPYLEKLSTNDFVSLSENMKKLVEILEEG